MTNEVHICHYLILWPKELCWHSVMDKLHCLDPPTSAKAMADRQGRQEILLEAILLLLIHNS